MDSYALLIELKIGQYSGIFKRNIGITQTFDCFRLSEIPLFN